jgi:hypothetical protein
VLGPFLDYRCPFLVLQPEGLITVPNVYKAIRKASPVVLEYDVVPVCIQEYDPAFGLGTPGDQESDGDTNHFSRAPATEHTRFPRVAWSRADSEASCKDAGNEAKCNGGKPVPDIGMTHRNHCFCYVTGFLDFPVNLQRGGFEFT